MPPPVHPDLEARLRNKVDRAVARYEGKVPPYMMAKLRELAERYWREDPEAWRILNMPDHHNRTRSGNELTTGAAAAPAGHDRARRTGKE